MERTALLAGPPMVGQDSLPTLIHTAVTAVEAMQATTLVRLARLCVCEVSKA